MALGGGTFVTQNKELPGSYINFISAASANAALSERGIGTMPLELDWGPEDEIFEVTSEAFQKNSQKIFGYAYTDDKMKSLRDFFLNAQTLYAYRLNGGGKKASNSYAKAKYPGIRGNELKTVIQVNPDNEELFDVKTMLGTTVVDEQTVAKAAELTANDYVEWENDTILEAAASVPFTGGENGTADGAAHQTYLAKIEPYTYNVMGVAVTDKETKQLYVSFCKRLRDEVGVKFQLVLYDSPADYYGVISVKNKTQEESWNEASLVYWVTGAEAGCAVNASLQNRKYDGNFSVNTDFTQTDLKNAIRDGEFVLHRVGADIRVLEDINTMVTISDTQGDIFKDNQTIRVIDQIGNDIAVLFRTKYLGVVPIDAAGRVSLWSDIVAHHRQLNQIRAIEDFSDADVIVTQGDTKKSVVVTDVVTVVNAMSKLYMTVTIL